MGELTATAWERSRALGEKRELDELSLDQASIRPRFADALNRNTVAVIAEMKRKSPSKGAINTALGAAAQAKCYAAGGAAALSVLTEPTRFGGSNDDIGAARGAELPILKKDFHVSEAQLVEARALGASAALIIVRAIEPSRLATLAEAARELDLEILFEVRDERELEQALSAGAILIGVNNRNLETLEIDADTVSRIIPLIPPTCIAIAESGYTTAADVERAAQAGADAVLIGSSLSASLDPETAVALLVGVSRHSRS
ncbi:MAG: indole-3-glycerol phosphate synthase TrpC [Gemmatimonadaceae bacterium]